jgi:P27 family predicted phage terminase small subunit
MPYPRKPTEQLRLAGTWRRDRHAKRRDVDGGGGDLTQPPPSLGEAELVIWRELQRIAPSGLLKIADSHLVERYCRATRRYRQAAEELGGRSLVTLQGTLNPLAGELRRAERALTEMGEALGLSPRSRMRLLDGIAAPEGGYAGMTSAFGELRLIRGNRGD